MLLCAAPSGACWASFFRPSWDSGLHRFVAVRDGPRMHSLALVLRKADPRLFASGGHRNDFPTPLRLRHGKRSARKRSNDLLTVKAAIFDKNFAGVVSADDHAGKVQAGNIALKRVRIESGLVR